MKKNEKSRDELLRENENLRLRAEQAEAALEASFKGELDAIVSPSSGKATLPTFPTMTYISRIFIEEMAEGAIVTDEKGTINYCNENCAALLGRPKSELIGSKFSAYVAERSKATYTSYFGVYERERRSVSEMYLLCSEDREVPVALSITPLAFQDVSPLCLTLYDLREERDRVRQIVEERDRFETLFNHIGEGIFIASLSGEIIELNRTAHERLGYSREDLLGKLLNEIDSPPYAEKTGQRIEELNSSGKLTYETEYVCSNGERIPIECHAKIVRFEGSKVILTVARDITERTNTEFALRQSEVRYKSLFESIRDAILVADTKRKIVACNSAFSSIFGYTIEEIRGKDSSYVYASKEQAEEMGTALKRNFDEHKPFLFTVNYRKKSGEVFLGETGVHYLKDEKGRVNGFIDLIRDVSEKREAEKALKSSQEFQCALISTSPVAIHGIDIEDRIIFWNESCERIFGWKEKEVLGEFLPSIPEECKESQRSLLSRVLSGEKIFDIEVERQRKNGERFYGSLSAAPLYNSDGVLRGVVATIADVTEKKKLEEQLLLTQKLEAVGRLAGGVAHDFNNMLMVIKGFSQIVRNKTDPEAAAYGHLMEIEKAVRRAADLTNQLLAYSRKQELHIESVDINTVLEASRKMLEQLIGENITIRMTTDHSVPLIRADINQLHQIIVNLATNARDAMPAGGTLEYLVEPAEFGDASKTDPRIIAPGTYVRLRVRDTGEGMDEDTVSHLFEPFYTTKSIGEGTGLGLATTYGTVKQLNGYIFCTSEKGKGTEFSLYFPVTEERESEAMELEGAPWSLSGDETVLLVEDEQMVRDALSVTLRERGYNVLEAAEGRRAWELFQESKNEIALLISDVIMPGESGIELAKRFIVEAPSLKMIFLSGYSETNEDTMVGLTNQWKRFQKPIDPDELMYEVRKLLDAQE